MSCWLELIKRPVTTTSSSSPETSAPSSCACATDQPPDSAATPSCAEAGVLGVLPGIVGTLQAAETLKILLGIGQPLVGRLLLIDALAMDFRVTRRNRPRLVALARELDEIVLAAGGRFYFAKDSTLTPQAAAAFLGEEALAQFRALKRRCDPEGILQTNLWRRLFVPLATI